MLYYLCVRAHHLRVQVGVLDDAVQAQRNPLIQHAASIVDHKEALQQVNGQVWNSFACDRPC